MGSAFGGALCGGVIGAVPGAAFALTQASKTSVQTVLLVVSIGVLIVTIPTVAAGAWLNLRGQGYDGSRQTALILGAMYGTWALVLGLVYAVILKLTSAPMSGVVVVVALVAVLVPPLPARALYLWLKAAGRIG